jgi:dimethylhistidine N-methyltransferase
MSESRISSRTPGAETSAARFASDVEYYLAQRPRQLPSRYFYDALGSALFDAICHLPWYRVTRAELRLIHLHAAAILQQVEPLATVVELGPGNGEKLTALMSARPAAHRGLELHLVDVSTAALERAASALSALENLHIITHEASYEAGLADATNEARATGRALALFLGSNIGNFDPPGADAFLRGIRAALADGDGLLIGADLVKPEAELVAAYDDPLGVTAAFNRNLLVRINRELGGTFDVHAFGHRAVWNSAESRVEMHLVSLRRQHVEVPAANLAFTLEEGETIWTESSYKYRPDDLIRMLERAGFTLADQFVDKRDCFALTLVEAI